MLRNFVTTADLIKYDLAIERFLPQTAEGSQTDWSIQIAEAFEQIKDKLRQKNVQSRLMGLPLDLNRAATSTEMEHTLRQLVRTESFTGTHINGQDGFRRFAVNIIAMAEESGYAFVLQGSNDLAVDDSTEPENWCTVQTIEPDGLGETTIVFQDEYSYYRLLLPIAGEASSITFTACIYETYQDRWIIWLTLSLIYRMISKGADDVWLKKAQDALALFETSFENYPFNYDSDGDNLPDSDELHSATIRLFR